MVDIPWKKEPGALAGSANVCAASPAKVLGNGSRSHDCWLRREWRVSEYPQACPQPRGGLLQGVPSIEPKLLVPLGGIWKKRRTEMGQWASTRSSLCQVAPALMVVRVPVRKMQTAKAEPRELRVVCPSSALTFSLSDTREQVQRQVRALSQKAAPPEIRDPRQQQRDQHERERCVFGRGGR